MIPRYARPEMTAIWEPATKFRIWYEIEAHACDAQAKLGVIPQENADAVWKAKDVEFDVARIDEIEAVTKHDVIAFLTHLAEHVGSDEARFVHQGMTSSDVLDTCLNVQLVRAADILLEGVDKVLAALKKRALEHKMTVRVGRSHGIHAEPTTMGLTFARFYAEMDRNKNRLEKAKWEIATGAISGAELAQSACSGSAWSEKARLSCWFDEARPRGARRTASSSRGGATTIWFAGSSSSEIATSAGSSFSSATGFGLIWIAPSPSPSSSCTRPPWE